MIERAKTYVVKQLPHDIKTVSPKEMIDLYMLFSSSHPQWRVRKNRDILETTKNIPLIQQDNSSQEEQTIQLSKEECNFLRTIPPQRVRVHHIRYNYTGHSS
jgi:hypothetical protein